MNNLTVAEARAHLDRLASWGVVESFQHVHRPTDCYVIGLPDENGGRVLVLTPHGLRGFLEGVAAARRAEVA